MSAKGSARGKGALCPRELALAQLRARALASALTCSLGSRRGAGLKGSCWDGCAPSLNAASPHAGDGREDEAVLCLALGWDVWQGSGHGVQRGMGCAGVLVRGLDAPAKVRHCCAKPF